MVKFTKLKFGTQLTTKNITYKQIHLRIDVDSHQGNAEAEGINPQKTPYSDGEVKQISSTKSVSARAFTSGITVAPNPQGTVSFTGSKSIEKAAGNEEKQILNRIDQYDNDGKVWWSFDIDDAHYQEKGRDLEDDHLPTVRFVFTGDSDEPEPPPTPPPKDMDIVITSYWKLTLPNEPKSTWIHKLLHFKSSGKAQTLSYSNLFQIVVLEADLDKLLGLCRYKAEVIVNLDPASGASNPHEVEVKRRVALGSVHVIPVVVDSKYITLLTCELYEFNETNIFRSTELNIFR